MNMEGDPSRICIKYSLGDSTSMCQRHTRVSIGIAVNYLHFIGDSILDVMSRLEEHWRIKFFGDKQMVIV